MGTRNVIAVFLVGAALGVAGGAQLGGDPEPREVEYCLVEPRQAGILHHSFGRVCSNARERRYEAIFRAEVRATRQAWRRAARDDLEAMRRVWRGR